MQEDTAEEEVEHDIATDNRFKEEESEVGETVEEEFVFGEMYKDPLIVPIVCG